MRLRTVAGRDAVLALHVDQRTAIVQFVFQTKDLLGFALDDALTEIALFDICEERGEDQKLEQKSRKLSGHRIVAGTLVGIHWGHQPTYPSLLASLKSLKMAKKTGEFAKFGERLYEAMFCNK